MCAPAVHPLYAGWDAARLGFSGSLSLEHRARTERAFRAPPNVVGAKKLKIETVYWLNLSSNSSICFGKTYKYSMKYCSNSII